MAGGNTRENPTVPLSLHEMSVVVPETDLLVLRRAAYLIGQVEIKVEVIIGKTFPIKPNVLEPQSGGDGFKPHTRKIKEGEVGVRISSMIPVGQDFGRFWMTVSTLQAERALRGTK